MLKFLTTANASYIANRNRQRLLDAAQVHFAGLGESLWSVNPQTDNPNTLEFAFDLRPDGAPQTVTQQQVNAFMAAHDNSVQTTAQKATAQAQSAVDNLLPHLEALINLPAADVGYAAMGRAMAFKDGASGATINAIVDRATATSYLTSKSEWTGLPVASRNWLADHLEMEAFLFQILILVLRK